MGKVARSEHNLLSQTSGMPIPQGGIYDITIFQGATFEQSFLLREPDGTTVIPLTGYEARSQVREAAGGALLAELECDVDGALGKVDVSADSGVSGGITKSGVWSLEIYNDDDPPIVRVLLTGRCVLVREITEEDEP